MPPRLFALRLACKPALARATDTISDSTLGLAVVDGTTLRALRNQDHLRALGRGSEFIRLLLARVQVCHVEIRAGHYGPVGVVSLREAVALLAEIEALREQALRHRRAMN
ncbi:MAG: hypothetical protein AMXMBFR59_00420 [Rhodanobacteraceae bacterium]